MEPKREADASEKHLKLRILCVMSVCERERETEIIWEEPERSQST